MTNREIGGAIGTTEQVIKNYLRVIFDKLGVWSRLELALYIANHGGTTWRHTAEQSVTDAGDSEAEIKHVSLGR
jgi:hypothetical protein